jgi:putative Mg2+ transporter-C (MgtC) family protein
MHFAMDVDVSLFDSAMRLGAAVIVGIAIGLDRELRGKSVGVRTLALVSLGAALICIATVNVEALRGEPDATSRVVQGVVQGVMTGIGFLGAGTVIQREREGRVKGLTTAATVWVTAALGVACGFAAWSVLAVGVVLTLLVLTVLHFVENWLERRIERLTGQLDADA